MIISDGNRQQENRQINTVGSAFSFSIFYDFRNSVRLKVVSV
jgi:hypothetical protein